MNIKNLLFAILVTLPGIITASQRPSAFKRVDRQEKVNQAAKAARLIMQWYPEAATGETVAEIKSNLQGVLMREEATLSTLQEQDREFNKKYGGPMTDAMWAQNNERISAIRETVKRTGNLLICINGISDNEFDALNVAPSGLEEQD